MADKPEDKKKVEVESCPECGASPLIIVAHCKTCPVCGWSLCSL